MLYRATTPNIKYGPMEGKVTELWKLTEKGEQYNIIYNDKLFTIYWDAKPIASVFIDSSKENEVYEFGFRGGMYLIERTGKKYVIHGTRMYKDKDGNDIYCPIGDLPIRARIGNPGNHGACHCDLPPGKRCPSSNPIRFMEGAGI